MSQARVLNATGEDNKCQQEGPKPKKSIIPFIIKFDHLAGSFGRIIWQDHLAFITTLRTVLVNNASHYILTCIV